MSENSENGGNAYWWAGELVRPLILEQAKLRVESTFATLTALNSRLASLGGLLFAGAALTTTTAISVDKLTFYPRLVASFAALLFAFGGLSSFVGLFSGQSVFAGEAPSWWAKQGLQTLREMEKENAEHWIAGHLEENIISLKKAVRRRGIAINWSIGFGAAGGFFIPAAAAMALIFPKPVDPASPMVIRLQVTFEQTVPKARIVSSSRPAMPYPQAP